MGRKPELRPLQPPPPQQPSPIPSPLTPSPLPSPLRRQPLILRENGVVKISGKQRCAEVAGGTAAGCAAVCCCCPCGLLSLLVLTVVRLPAGLCKKAIRRRRMTKNMNNEWVPRSNKALLGDGNDVDRLGATAGVGLATVWPERTTTAEAEEEMKEMEKMMWEQFEKTGFWRSPSQRDS